jgi:hypothetical protein
MLMRCLSLVTYEAAMSQAVVSSELIETVKLTPTMGLQNRFIQTGGEKSCIMAKGCCWNALRNEISTTTVLHSAVNVSDAVTSWRHSCLRCYYIPVPWWWLDHRLPTYFIIYYSLLNFSNSSLDFQHSLLILQTYLKVSLRYNWLE